MGSRAMTVAGLAGKSQGASKEPEARTATGRFDPFPQEDYVKKALVMTAALALGSLALTACGSSGNSETVTEVMPETVTTDAVEATTAPTTTSTPTTTPAKAQPVSFRKTCNIVDVPNVRNPQVGVDVAASNLVPSQADQGSCATVGSVVKTIGRQQIEMPTRVQGFRCNPIVHGGTLARYNCVFQAADNAGKVVLTWQMRYTG